MSISMSGNDTIIINGRSLVDLADGDCITIDFANNIANAKTGKDGSSIYALNQTGNQADVKLRVIRGSDDDKFLNNLLIQQNANFAGFPLMTGEFIKKIGDGKGNVSSDTYLVSGGIFAKRVAGKSNQEGDTDQSVSSYELLFTNAPRIIT